MELIVDFVIYCALKGKISLNLFIPGLKGASNKIHTILETINKVYKL